jgi:hypothetical protein
MFYMNAVQRLLIALALSLVLVALSCWALA